MPTFRTVTLGCKVNQYETEYVRQGLARLGYREADRDEPADLCLVNTCTVTATADAKSRKAIRRLARQNPGARIIAMGCYATRAAEEIRSLDGVCEVVTDKARLPDLLESLGLDEPPSGISTFGNRHRAYVKVQDGCQMACSYCIIPTCRPVLVSRPADEVLDEISRLVANGYREIVLTGIHLGHYGVDLDRSINLAGLVRRITDLEGPFRVRISSIEATEATDELIDMMSDRPDRICPHLHLSMQSGSDSVLRRMNRPGTIAAFIGRCDLARRRLDNPALTTDAIVGFPGETESEHEQTCRVVRQIGFSKVHVFPFSPRQGTPAAEMSDQVPEPIKQRRAAQLEELAGQLRGAYFETLLGRQLQVLVETAPSDRPGVLQGTSARYAPVELPGTPDQIGQLVLLEAGSLAEGRIRMAD